MLVDILWTVAAFASTALLEGFIATKYRLGKRGSERRYFDQVAFTVEGVRLILSPLLSSTIPLQAELHIMCNVMITCVGVRIYGLGLSIRVKGGGKL